MCACSPATLKVNCTTAIRIDNRNQSNSNCCFLISDVLLKLLQLSKLCSFTFSSLKKWTQKLLKSSASVYFLHKYCIWISCFWPISDKYFILFLQVEFFDRYKVWDILPYYTSLIHSPPQLFDTCFSYEREWKLFNEHCIWKIYWNDFQEHWILLFNLSLSYVLSLLYPSTDM